MQGFAEEKISGGKLVKATLEFEESISAVKITGDFFLYPEEAIADIENSLLNLPAAAGEQTFAEKILQSVRDKNIEFVGFDAQAVARVVAKAIEAGKQK